MNDRKKKRNEMKRNKNKKNLSQQLPNNTIIIKSKL